MQTLPLALLARLGLSPHGLCGACWGASLGDLMRARRLLLERQGLRLTRQLQLQHNQNPLQYQNLHRRLEQLFSLRLRRSHLGQSPLCRLTLITCHTHPTLPTTLHAHHTATHKGHCHRWLYW
jgi:hypothetical protein